ncbi:efflux RND transporter permease subunit [Galbitalea soli]|uniref:Efflux RND transporter permease subunit n=1 Tax=Galbitalea soli TaxID=1268042 RepID=A0A7C9PNY0_9MICO|nr:efflux RND transporter permease subunit [Galbitalea soli]NEM91930.1 efflux RND transporter permease subunit [Galbitalea soli]NYJ29231.1 HAE1 family hydrophobic/amphiphilic exporter-1 [Galbitalea soli]
MHLLSVFSLRNRALIALVTIVIGIFGGIALTTLKQELIPSITSPQLVIISSYPGATPAVVEHDVSTPIETAIQGVEGLDTTTATSRSSASTVSATFKYGTDITTSEQKVQLAIDRLTLPSGVTPQVVTGSIDDLPVIQLAVTSDLSGRDLTTALKKSTIDALQSLDGVREASLLGTLGQRVTITPDLDALKKKGLTTQSIKDALSANGTLLASGDITENGKTLVVQAGQQITSVDQLDALPLLGSATTATGTAAGSAGGAAAARAGVPVTPTPAATPKVITLGSVATVRLTDDPATGISRVNGKPALTIAVTKRPDGNTVAVSKLVNKQIPALETALGHNTRFTVVFDQAPYIQQSIDDLATEGLLGLTFAVIIILIFLFSIRSTLVTAISIPASVLITFIGMLAAGYSLNIITLGALTIAIGRVVDDSIVVIENIKRHIATGEEKLPAILGAVREVAGAVTASTVTTVAVFLPLALVSGQVGELFRPFALTVTIALAASLFVALTIVPVLAYWFLGSGRRRGKAAAAAAAPAAEVDELEKPSRLQKAYIPIIRWTTHRVTAALLVVLLAVLVLGGTVFMAGGLKTNFIGDSGQNTLTVSQQLPLGASLDAKNAAATRVEKALEGVKGVDIVQLSIGSSGSSLRQAFGSGGDITFSLTTDAAMDQAAIQSRVRTAIDGLSGVGTVALQGASAGFASSDITVTVTAQNDAQLRTAAGQVYDAVKGLSVTGQSSSNLSNQSPYIAVRVDRAKAAKKSMSELAVGSQVAEAMNPSASGTVVINDTTLSIYITNPKEPLTAQGLKDYKIQTPLGTTVPLSDLASVAVVNGPASITTIKGVQSATVTVTPKGDNTGGASAAVTAAVNKLSLPAGAKATIGGVTSSQSDAFGQLGYALLAAILIVYIVMVATFKSLRQPLLLLASVPFAATGAIALQKISNIPLGVPSLIGVLMLIGIVVTNAIVLVDLVNQYRRRGYRVGESIVHGASRRLRPILMTALATIFALLPMALGVTGKGGFISQPLAIVVIGGLVSSTLLTLVVLPALYYLVEGARERRTDRRERKAAAALTPAVPDPSRSTD